MPETLTIPEEYRAAKHCNATWTADAAYLPEQSRASRQVPPNAPQPNPRLFEFCCEDRTHQCGLSHEEHAVAYDRGENVLHVCFCGHAWQQEREDYVRWINGY